MHVYTAYHTTYIQVTQSRSNPPTGARRGRRAGKRAQTAAKRGQTAAKRGQATGAKKRRQTAAKRRQAVVEPAASDSEPELTSASEESECESESEFESDYECDDAGKFNERAYAKQQEMVEVKEVDGKWREVTVYKPKADSQRIVLHVGGTEYEGLGPLRYTSKKERGNRLVMRDEDGDVIEWRKSRGLQRRSSNSSRCTRSSGGVSAQNS